MKRDLNDERANDVNIWGESSLSRGNKGKMKDVKGNNLEVFEEQQGACVAVASSVRRNVVGGEIGKASLGLRENYMG